MVGGVELDDDDTRSICTTVLHGLERVEEEEQMVRQEQQQWDDEEHMRR